MLGGIMKLWIGVVFSSQILVLLGCNKSSESSTAGWGVSGTAFGSRTLQVCYENRSVADGELVSFTKSILSHAKTEFSKTNLSLAGLGPCGPKGHGSEVRLSWLDAEDLPNPHYLERLEGMSQIGNGFLYGATQLTLPQRVPSGVRANPTLVLNSYVFKRIQKDKGTSNAESHFKSVFLHEMGHAVGLLHEHAQAKSTCSITKETVALHMDVWKKAGISQSNVEVVGTSYDPYSVMNYCYLFERGSVVAVGFSNKDIQTINALYPKPTAERQREAGPVNPEMTPAVGQPQVIQQEDLRTDAQQADGMGTSGSPQFYPTAAPSTDTMSSSSSCNQAQLKICLDYSGGDACYSKWGCMKP